MIEADLQDNGVDLGDRAMMRDRSWRWLRGRILSLLNRPVQFVPVRSGDSMRLVPMFRTRLQDKLAPPPLDEPLEHYS